MLFQEENERREEKGAFLQGERGRSVLLSGRVWQHTRKTQVDYPFSDVFALYHHNFFLVHDDIRRCILYQSIWMVVYIQITVNYLPWNWVVESKYISRMLSMCCLCLPVKPKHQKDILKHFHLKKIQHSCTLRPCLRPNIHTYFARDDLQHFQILSETQRKTNISPLETRMNERTKGRNRVKGGQVRSARVHVCPSRCDSIYQVNPFIRFDTCAELTQQFVARLPSASESGATGIFGGTPPKFSFSWFYCIYRIYGIT